MKYLAAILIHSKVMCILLLVKKKVHFKSGFFGF